MGFFQVSGTFEIFFDSCITKAPKLPNDAGTIGVVSLLAIFFDVIKTPDIHIALGYSNSYHPSC